MKKVLTSILLTITTLCVANAGDKYNDLTSEYIAKLDTKVKKMVALDPQTNKNTLEVLSHDNDLSVRIAAKDNLLKQK